MSIRPSLVGFFICLVVVVHSAHAVQVDFVRDVAPILARRCLSCHDEREHKGDFRMDSRQSLLDSGYVEPGDLDSSVLWEVIRAEGKRPARMPKDSDPLTDDQVAKIGAWIKSGARWPDDYQLEPPKVTDRNWWSLKPLASVFPPLPKTVEGKSWVRSPIDAFVLAAMNEKGLDPSRPADRRTLIRRLTYDLTGLPPTPHEVAAFVDDPSPLAYEHLVDRLLSSPQYGERWARHWLDVVHYADTHGYDKDKLRPNAWPYRDYVIRAFNTDKPYRRFVQEQLAGDALFADTVDGQVATGFIAAGPWDFIGHAEVPETKLDGKVARNLDRDNMVTSTLNTFCSLTVQCARCHHHKLDPVTMEDYYSLQAVFAAIDRADRDYDISPEIARARAELQSQKSKLAVAVKAHRETEANRKTPEIKSLEKRLDALRQGAVAANTKLPRSSAYGYHSQVARTQDSVKWVQVDLGAEKSIQDVYLFGADEYGFADFGFPHRFRVEVSSDSAFKSSQTVGRFEGVDAPRPGGQGVHVSVDNIRARYVRVTATKLWSRRHKGQPLSNDWIFALGEMAVVADGRHQAVVEVTSKDSIEAGPRWSRTALVDGVFGTHSLDALKGGAKRSETNGYHSQFASKAATTKSITLELKQGYPIDRILLVPAFPTDWKDTPGFGFPTRFRIETANDADFQDPTTVLDQTKNDFANPGQRRIALTMSGRSPQQRTARYVRLTATKLWDRGDNKFALALAEMEVWSGGTNVARGAKVTASDSIEGGRWSKAALVDDHTSRMPVSEVAADLASLARSASVDADLRTLTERRDQLLKAALGESVWRQHRARESELADVESRLDGLPKPQRVYTGVVHHGSGAFRGRGGLGPREIFVLHRGNINQPTRKVESGAPPLAPGVKFEFGLTDEDPEWRRRTALSDWIVHDDNPLTWRSIVNRIWVHHFGRGLADTPNDFGRGGKQPTHPLLLDWLAREFRDSGGSIKSLHRLIVTSAVYRQASEDEPSKQRLDADNQFYWRMNRRRLSAEEVRDSMLMVANRLNRQQGGPGFMDFIIEHPQHSPHYEYEKHDPADLKSHRRTVYRFIVRSQPQPFMDTLDCADPSISVPKRDETLTSLQALAMLNNRFVVAMADMFAQHLEASESEKTAQIRRAISLTLGRSPADAELKLLAEYAQRHGLANTCRLIFNLNEFVFVD